MWGMRYVALGRVSTTQQTDNYSRAVQFDAIHAYAKQQNWTPVAEFFDTASGSEKGLSERDGLTQALALLRAKKADYLIMNEVSRLGREAVVIKELIDRVYEYGGRLGVASERRLYDSALEAQELLFWQGAVSQYEYLLIKRRTGRGKKKAFEAGSHIWKTIFGYRLEKVDGIKKVVPHPEESQVVVGIAEKFIEGQDKTEIVRWGLSLGFNLSLRRVSKILKDDIGLYAGGSRNLSITIEGVKYEREVFFPAIITTEMYKKVLKVNRVVYRRDRQPTPYLGIVECYCGGTGSGYVYKRNSDGTRRVQISCSTVPRARARVHSGKEPGPKCKHSLSSGIISEELLAFLGKANEEFNNSIEALTLVVKEGEALATNLRESIERIQEKRIGLIDSLGKMENLVHIAEAVNSQLGKLKEEEDALRAVLSDSRLSEDKEKLERIKGINWDEATDKIFRAIKTDNWKEANQLLADIGVRILIDFNHPEPRQTLEVQLY